MSIRQEEVPVLVPPMELSINTKNQLDTTVRTGVINMPQARKTPTTQEFITDTTQYNTGADSNLQRIIRNGIDGSTPAASGSGISAVAVCGSPIPPYVCIWNVSIGNIVQTVTGTTPYFRETSKFHTSINIILTNYSNAPFIGSQILHDKLSVSSGRNI